jgi:hypothetical protein
MKKKPLIIANGITPVFDGFKIPKKKSLGIDVIGTHDEIGVGINDTPRERMLILNESIGVGTSHSIEHLTKDAFIIDTDKHNLNSLIDVLSTSKNEPNVIVIGSSIFQDKEILRAISASGIKATVIVEDIDNVFNKRKSLKEELLSSPVKDIKLLKSFDDDIKKDMPKSGGNNRKVNKRKKARNGRSKK